MIRPKRNLTKLMQWGSVFTVLGFVLYPIIISPIMNPEHYKNIQKETRKNIIQKDVQPGNMNVWSDPFKKKENEPASK